MQVESLGSDYLSKIKKKKLMHPLRTTSSTQEPGGREIMTFGGRDLEGTQNKGILPERPISRQIREVQKMPLPVL